MSAEVLPTIHKGSDESSTNGGSKKPLQNTNQARVVSGYRKKERLNVDLFDELWIVPRFLFFFFCFDPIALVESVHVRPEKRRLMCQLPTLTLEASQQAWSTGRPPNNACQPHRTNQTKALPLEGLESRSFVFCALKVGIF